MSAVTNNAEGGTSGTAVTTGNSGGASGTAFTGTSATGGSALTYDSGVSAHGLLSYKHALVSGAFTTFYQYTITATGTLVLRVYVYFDTLPGAAIRVVDIRTGAATVLRLQTNASNQFEVQDVGGIQLTSSAFTAAQWYRFEVNISTISATVGAYTASLFVYDSLAPFATFTTSTGNTGSTNITVINVGSTATSTASSVLHTDDYAHDPAGTAFFGPVQTTITSFMRRARQLPPLRRRRIVSVVPAQVILPNPTIIFVAVPRRIRGMYRRQHIAAVPVAQQVLPPLLAQRVPRRPAPPKRKRQGAIPVPPQTVPPLLARREPRRPPIQRHVRPAAKPLPTILLPPAFVRQAVGRKVRWITAKIRRPAPTQWPQSVYTPPPPFEWEGEWLIGIVDREWIVGNPDIDPSGLK